MKTFTAVVERCPETQLFVGYISGPPGAHSQGEMLNELNRNLREVIEMLLADVGAQFVGAQAIEVSAA